MHKIAVIQDLFHHNDWANQRVSQLCEDLSDEQLDESRNMGFGSLRNTLFHILEAEKIWLERWLGESPRAFATEAEGMPISEIAEQSRRVAKKRNQVIAEEAATDFGRVVQFVDSRGNPGGYPIGHLMNHVSNHGIHHRAQALSYLKAFRKTVPGGLDYLFWKIASPSCTLPEASLEPLRKFGLEAATSSGSPPRLEAGRIKSYFAYNDWAMGRIFEECRVVEESQLDRDLNLGMGTLRKNLQHMIDAERWWLRNWERDRSSFPRGEPPRPLGEMQALFAETSERRNDFIDSLDETAADRIVFVTAGGPETCFRITESLLQLCGHGTHHRSQCVNMLKQLGRTFSWIDMIVWVRENDS